MKIESVSLNNHRRAFEFVTARGTFAFPYAKADPSPTAENPITHAFIDPELGEEAVTYTLASGLEGSVHVEQALDYNREPEYMRDALVYRLTLEAKRRVAAGPLSRREIIRRMGTSPAQFYRLLDTTNYRKSIDSLLRLLAVLDCDVELVVKD